MRNVFLPSFHFNDVKINVRLDEYSEMLKNYLKIKSLILNYDYLVIIITIL